MLYRLFIDIFAEPGAKDDGNLLVELPDFGRQLDTRHLRHCLIGDYQVKRRGLLMDMFQGGLTAIFCRSGFE